MERYQLKAFVTVAAVMAQTLWFDDGGYTAAGETLQLLAVLCLSSAALGYLLMPLWRVLARGAGTG